MRKSPLERFHSRYIIDPETGCFNWTGTLNKFGYGRLYYVNKKEIKAHRFAYETYVGTTNDLFVLHKCDNRRCVNPEHLFLGTNEDNMKDKVLKNRQTKGEEISQSILNSNEVLEIKIALLNPYHGIIRNLAKKYKVSDATIHHIKTGKNWSHLKI